MKKRILCLGLAAALVMFTGCGDLSIRDQYLGFFNPEDRPASTEEASVTALSELRVPVDINDSMHPYQAVGETNLALMPLLYDSLIKVDEQYRPIPWLAESVEMQGTVCTLRLRQGVTFSNGAPLTGEDVVASYRLAVSQPRRYGQLAELVSNCTAQGNTVIFTLFREDQNFPGLLSFPILQASAAEEENPPGTGRYRFAQGRGDTLVQNPGHWAGGGPIQTIHLTEIPDRESLTYSLKTGVVDYLFTDLSSPELYSISSAGQMVELGNLVYIGINQQRSLLNLSAFRQAIEPYFNRGRMVSRVYSNRAAEAPSPYPPGFYQLPQELPRQSRSADEQKMALDSMGLATLDEEGYRLYEGERVSFRLVYNSENPYREQLAQQVVEDMRSCGIAIELVPLDFAEYQRALAAGSYDLYLGEVKLDSNLDISPLLSGAALGVADSVFDLNLMNRYREYQAGDIRCEEFLQSFYSSQPVIPLLYRRGMVAYSHNFSSRVVATAQDIFYNIAGW